LELTPCTRGGELVSTLVEVQLGSVELEALSYTWRHRSFRNRFTSPTQVQTHLLPKVCTTYSNACTILNICGESGSMLFAHEEDNLRVRTEQRCSLCLMYMRAQTLEHKQVVLTTCNITWYLIVSSIKPLLLSDHRYQWVHWLPNESQQPTRSYFGSTWTRACIPP
jgi:hypothetical protein